MSCGAKAHTVQDEVTRTLMLITSAYVLQQMYPASQLYTLSSFANFLPSLVFTTLLK
jgi:hypothetical protein